MKKYKLMERDRIVVGKSVLYRIESIQSFSNVKKGDLGGYVEKEDNLSHRGNCWVGDDAKVCGNAWVYDTVWVSEDAQVSGNTQVSGDARVL